MHVPRNLILGHRGTPYEAPENTLAGFALAMEQGADGVELDVQLSADGSPVVIHDETLERTTDGVGRVADHPDAQLVGLRSAGEPIPSLAQAVGWAAGADAWLNIEIKASAGAESTLRALSGGDLRERVILSSFHPAVVAEIGRIDGSLPRFLLTRAWDPEAQRALAECGAGGVCLHVDAASSVALDALAREGLPVIVWTVDEPEKIRELLETGVAAIITNRPGLAAWIRG